MKQLLKVRRLLNAIVVILAVVNSGVANAASGSGVTISVKAVSATPTCLGRLYHEILVPSGWGTLSDLTAATKFANSDQGTLGLTIFFEVRPNAGSDYSASGQAVEQSIGFTALNLNSTIGFMSSNYTTFKAKTKKMSEVWEHYYDGSGNLNSTQKTALISILNETPTSQNCNGLIYALQMGQNISAKNGGGNDPGHPPANIFNVGTYAPGSLWFNSSGTSPSSGAFFINSFNTPKYPSGSYTWYFYGQNNVTHGTFWY